MRGNINRSKAKEIDREARGWKNSPKCFSFNRKKWLININQITRAKPILTQRNFKEEWLWRRNKKLRDILRRLLRKNICQELINKNGKSFLKWFRSWTKRRSKKLSGRMELFSMNKLNPVTPEWWDFNIYKKQNKWQLEWEEEEKIQTRWQIHL